MFLRFYFILFYFVVGCARGTEPIKFTVIPVQNDKKVSVLCSYIFENLGDDISSIAGPTENNELICDLSRTHGKLSQKQLDVKLQHIMLKVRGFDDFKVRIQTVEEACKYPQDRIVELKREIIDIKKIHTGHEGKAQRLYYTADNTTSVKTQQDWYVPKVKLKHC